jgi:hypothetical protein
VRINVIGGKGVRKLPLFKRKELVQRRDLHEGMRRQKQQHPHGYEPALAGPQRDPGARQQGMKNSAEHDSAKMPNGHEIARFPWRGIDRE